MRNKKTTREDINKKLNEIFEHEKILGEKINETKKQIRDIENKIYCENIFDYDIFFQTGKKFSIKKEFKKHVERLEYMEKELNEQEREKENYEKKIYDLFSKLKNNDLETILIKRYIFMYSFDKIANELYYSVSAIRKKHNEALEKLIESMGG